MDIMEQLLCPQVCMDVDDTPLQLDQGKDDRTELDFLATEITDDDKIRLLLDLENFDPAQIPEELAPHEKDLKLSLYDKESAVQTAKVHCSVCNIHIGTAPIHQFDRYIHPLLHVVTCKTCYDFYCSGEFEKDEDGSELHCRWCGQGGNVMCCSDCAFVFCQKCVRYNLGPKILNDIKNCDDWKCFSCDPHQIAHLKIKAYAVYEYTKEQVKKAKNTVDRQFLKLDLSQCCTEKMRKVKVHSNYDSSYKPNGEPPSKKKKKEVVKKPPPIQQPPPRPAAPPTQLHALLSSIPKNAMPNPVPLSNLNTILLLPQSVAGNNIILCAPQQVPSSNQSVVPQLIPFNANMLNCKAPIINGNKIIVDPVLNTAIMSKSQFVLPTQQWFNAAQIQTNKITNHLAKRLFEYSKERRGCTSLEQLANIHNKLQELLSTTINSLISVRKTMRQDFISDIQNFGKAACEPPDDDVIFVNNDEDESTKEYEHILGTVGDPMKANDISNKDPLYISDDEPEKNDGNSNVTSHEVSNQVDASLKTPKVECDDIDAILPDVDNETRLEIQRTLVESRFESIVQANQQIKVPGLPEEERQRALCMRVTLNDITSSSSLPSSSSPPPMKSKKDDQINENVQLQDFEEMLSGSVVNKVIKQPEHFDSAYSQFLDDNIVNDNAKSEYNDESNKIIDSSSVNHVSMTDDLRRQLESLQSCESNMTFNNINQLAVDTSG